MHIHTHSNEVSDTYSQFIFTSVNSVNSITVSVEPPQTWLCTFLRSKKIRAINFCHTLLLLLSGSTAHTGAHCWTGSALGLCREEDTCAKRREQRGWKREGLFQTSRTPYIYSKLQIPVGDKLAKSLWSWPKAEKKYRSFYSGNLFSPPNEED